MKYEKRLAVSHIIAVLLLLISGCTNNLKVTFLPDKYADWKVSKAMIMLAGSEVKESDVSVSMDGVSYCLAYENMELQETEIPYSGISGLSGKDLIEFINACYEELQQLTGTDEIWISISGSEMIYETLDESDQVLLYDRTTQTITETTYDGAEGIAWTSIIDRDMIQIVPLPLIVR